MMQLVSQLWLPFSTTNMQKILICYDKVVEKTKQPL
jgi:hypothetical protein